MNVQDIEQALGKNAELVTIEATANKFIVRMKRREDKDTWQEIADAVKGLGGKWVYGKDSHGEIPFVKSNDDRDMQLQKALAFFEGELQRHEREIRRCNQFITELKEALK